jgi:uncharacterized protein YegP (UPF0339 family)
MPANRIELSGRHWRIRNHNGEILAHSEQYATKWNARRAANRLSKLTRFPVVEVTS